MGNELLDNLIVTNIGEVRSLLYVVCKSVQVPTIRGESILIDYMAAAHTFRKLVPDLFETLVKCPATFIKDREGALPSMFVRHCAARVCAKRGM